MLPGPGEALDLSVPLAEGERYEVLADTTADGLPAEMVVSVCAAGEFAGLKCRCGSARFVSVSFDTGFTRWAQCVPCGTVHPTWRAPGWKTGGAIPAKA